jgi:uncharacterized protein (TIGR04255 family)
VARQRHLSHAPLREALIDIQLTSLRPVEFAQNLEQFELPGFQRKLQLRFGEFFLHFGKDEPPQSKSKVEIAGWRYESSDGSRVVQLRRNGMTYSFLKGYTEWSDIKNAAQEVWRLSCAWAGDVEVGRVAVKYINVIESPPGAELTDYLITVPSIPEELPQRLAHFLTRVTIPFDKNILAIITTALEASSNIVFDIDVFSQQVFAGNSLEFWALLDRLREIKNSIFFSTVTEKALEAYE